MNDIKKLRGGLGLSQEQLAIYLNIERGLLSMAEIGKRELPTDALLKLNTLQQNIPKSILPKTTHLVATEITQQKSNLQTFVQQLQQLFLQKALHLQKQLTAIENKYTTSVLLLQAIRKLQQQLPDTAKNKKDILWYAATEAMLVERINANSLIVQKKLQLQIESLQWQAANA